MGMVVEKTSEEESLLGDLLLNAGVRGTLLGILPLLSSLWPLCPPFSPTDASIPSPLLLTHSILPSVHTSSFLPCSFLLPSSVLLSSPPSCLTNSLLCLVSPEEDSMWAQKEQELWG